MTSCEVACNVCQALPAVLLSPGDTPSICFNTMRAPAWVRNVSRNLATYRSGLSPP